MHSGLNVTIFIVFQDLTRGVRLIHDFSVHVYVVLRVQCSGGYFVLYTVCNVRTDPPVGTWMLLTCAAPYLVEYEKTLLKHGATCAAEAVENARNEIMRARRMAQRASRPATAFRQTTINNFFSKPSADNF